MFITSMEIRAFKYVANFNSQSTAEEFVAYVEASKYDNKQIIGTSGRVRNSVLFFCHDRKTGHDVGKAFEDMMIQKKLAELSGTNVVESIQNNESDSKDVTNSDESQSNKFLSFFNKNN